MSIKRFIAFILLRPKRLFCTLYNLFRHICENSYTIRIRVFIPRMQKHLVYPIFSIPLFSAKKQSRLSSRLRFLAFCSMYYGFYLQPQPSPQPQPLSATSIGITLQPPEPQLLKPLPPQRSNSKIIHKQSQPQDIPHSLKLFISVPPVLSRRGLSHPANSQYANYGKNVTSFDKEK